MTQQALKSTALCAVFALTAAPAFAAEGAQAAVEFGCLNCHGSQAHAAPKFKSLADGAARRGDPAKALQHWLDEMHEKDFVHTHTMVSDEAAKTVLQWVSQGMK